SKWRRAPPDARVFLTSVRQQPLTAMLSPIRAPRATTPARTAIRIPVSPRARVWIRPASSMIPVNMRKASGALSRNQSRIGRDPSRASLFDPRGQKDVLSDASPADIDKVEFLAGASRARSGNSLSCVGTPEDHGRVKEGDALDKRRGKEGGVHLAASFHKEMGDLFGTEILHEPPAIDPAL